LENESRLILANHIDIAAFGGLFYLSLYLAGKLHVLDNRGEVWKTYVVLVPTLAAALIAISRIMDARHHPFDVISGSLLGVLTAFAAYRQYFPPVSESWRKGRAYPIRSWGTEPLGPESKHQEREMARDQGVEPLRTAAAREDEEHLADVYAGAPNPAAGHDDFDQHQHPAYRHAGPSLAPQPPSHPPTANTSQRGHAEGNWSSLASDHEGDDDGYEMQPRYALNDSNSAGVQHDAYPSSSISGLNAPTAYNGARPTAGPPQIPPISMYSTHSGDLGVTHER
jgi:diacylglycerol diphosphate phosphatase/phosphatidate phosphatase